MILCDADVAKDNQVHDESQWDHVKRGICCLCQHSKIDSLLYRYARLTCLTIRYGNLDDVKYDVVYADVGTCAPVQIVQKIWSSLRESVQCAVPRQ